MFRRERERYTEASWVCVIRSRLCVSFAFYSFTLSFAKTFRLCVLCFFFFFVFISYYYYCISLWRARACGRARARGELRELLFAGVESNQQVGTDGRPAGGARVINSPCLALDPFHYCFVISSPIIIHYLSLSFCRRLISSLRTSLPISTYALN